MNNIILISAFLIFFNLSSAAAEDKFTDEEVFRRVYSLVSESYINGQPASQTALNVIKGLNVVDKKLQIADDSKRISLYYNGRIIKSFLKPNDANDVEAAVRLTGRFIKAAQSVSSKAVEKDFDIADILLENGINNNLDGDSKYYPQYGGKKEKFKNRRNFASRMIGKILYIKILAFNNYTMENFRKSFKDNQEFAGVILDLRSSPGGSLSVALKIADSFLDNEIIVSAQEKDKDANQFYNSSAGDIAQDKPLVTLVDGETTSSAEIVAVALKDQSRAKIIGTQTFGKGSRQDLFGLPNGAELGLTTAYFYAPSGKAIDGNGVQPDICTFEMLDRKNLEDILAKPSKDKCPQEVRENKNIDLDIAEAIINQQI